MTPHRSLGASSVRLGIHTQENSNECGHILKRRAAVVNHPLAEAGAVTEIVSHFNPRGKRIANE
jgi:hypothetical protein